MSPKEANPPAPDSPEADASKINFKDKSKEISCAAHWTSNRLLVSVVEDR